LTTSVVIQGNVMCCGIKLELCSYTGRF